MLEDYIDVIQVTPGRIQVAFGQMMLIVNVANSVMLVRRIGEAGAAAKTYDDQLAHWTLQLNMPSEAEAAGFDRLADRVVVGIQRQSRARQSAEVPGSREALSIDAFITRILPKSAVGITRLPFPDAILAEERLLAALQGPEAAMVQTLELGGLVARLADVLPKFKAAVNKLPSPQLAFEAVRTARNFAHNRLCSVVATVLSEFGDVGQEDLAAAALAPLERQIEAMRALRRASKPVTDLNPTTGAEVPVNPALVPPEA